MITQEVLDAAASVLTTAYHAVTGFEDLEILTYWPPIDYNPPHDVLILFEGQEYDTLLTNGLRGSPDGSSDARNKYQPDDLNLLYRQRAITQQTSVTLKQAQDRMRTAKLVLRDLFKPAPGFPLTLPQPINLNGTCLQAGRNISLTHPSGGPYERSGGAVIVRFGWWATIDVLSSVH